MSHHDPRRDDAPPSSRDSALLIALHACPAIPLAVACRLAAHLSTWKQEDLSRAPSLAAELGLPVHHLKRAMGLRAGARTAAAEHRRQADAAGMDLVTLGEAAYPASLTHLPQPPPVLYRRGRLPEALRRGAAAVAIVGSRRASPYGLEAADFFAGALAEAGVPVISGFARGIDQRAHRACLEAGGETVAVLGCGLDVDYPRGHRELGRRIAERGALLSEFPPGSEPRAWRFPVRNRLIAGLCQVVLVVEATARSGSLITVRHALDLDRDVFVVPGNIFHRGSEGPHGLLRDGAYPAIHPQDLLDALPERLVAAEEPPPPKLPGLGGRLVALLRRGEGTTADDLADAVGKSIDETLTALLELELEGWVQGLPSGTFGRRR